MRTTVKLDDDLWAKAIWFTGIKSKSGLIDEALRALIHRESARQLAKLGSSMPDLVVPPRRRSQAEHDKSASDNVDVCEYKSGQPVSKA
jgi:Arc/MetJ family transcription regulator